MRGEQLHNILKGVSKRNDAMKIYFDFRAVLVPPSHIPALLIVATIHGIIGRGLLTFDLKNSQILSDIINPWHIYGSEDIRALEESAYHHCMGFTGLRTPGVPPNLSHSRACALFPSLAQYYLADIPLVLFKRLRDSENRYWDFWDYFSFDYSRAISRILSLQLTTTLYLHAPVFCYF